MKSMTSHGITGLERVIQRNGFARFANSNAFIQTRVPAAEQKMDTLCVISGFRREVG
jgi:hypothetical protein